MPYFGIFAPAFENNFVIIEMSAFKFVQLDNFVDE